MTSSSNRTIRVYWEILEFKLFRGWVGIEGPIGSYSNLDCAEEDWQLWDLDNREGQYRLIKVTETTETEIVRKS